MVAEPTATLLTIPLDEPIVAIVLSLLAQVPPPSGSVKVVDWPLQISVEPAIGDGTSFTVNTLVAAQPVDN